MKTSEKKSRLRELSEEFERLERKLKLGGGAEKIEKIHKQGKLTARERIELLLMRAFINRKSVCSSLMTNTKVRHLPPPL